MREIRFLELAPRPFISHRKASSFKRLQKKSDSIFFPFSTYCHPFRSAEYSDTLRSVGLKQKQNFSVGQKWFLTLLRFSTYCDPKCTGFCDSRRIPMLTQKRSFSVGERRDLKFLQYSTSCDPCGIRLGCLKGDCVVDLNAEDASIPSNMLDLLRCGGINTARS